jgi:hypothetical protein
VRVETLFEQLFFTTLFLRTLEADGSGGAGTGFIYSVDVGPGEVAQVLVTNKHVIDGVKALMIRFLGAEDREMTTPSLGQLFDLRVGDPAGLFVGHPDADVDVAVAPLSPMLQLVRAQGFTPFFRAITPALLMTDENVGDLDAMEQIIFIGYPNGLHDAVNGLPIARQGVTATPPVLDYEGKPMFLVDASVFPGSSGSPVLLAQSGGFSVRGGNFHVGDRVMLLGLVAAIYQRNLPVLEARAADSFVQDALDIGVVYKARAIDETVDLFLERHGMKRHTTQPDEPISSSGEDEEVSTGDP